MARLIPEDWEIVEFYLLVHDQYRNQTPMGTNNETVPAILTPVMADWYAILKAYRYPEDEYERLIEGARYLFKIIHNQIKEPRLTEAECELPDGN